MTKTNIIAVIILITSSILLVTGLTLLLEPATPSDDTISKTNSDEKMVTPLAPKQLEAYNVTMTNDKNPIAQFTTNQGSFEIELFEVTMPITAGNFIKLASEGFYDGIKFHRVIDGFMIQGGDPITKTEDVMRYGTGGPGYSIPDEHISGEFLTNIRGTISMANSGPNSGGSQFFINLNDNTNLDFDKPPLSSQHPVFGHVLKGMDVVDKIALVEVNPSDMPLEPVIIESVKIVRQ